MISIIITLILAGSVFFTCGLFNETENPPKEYFVIITVSLLLIVCLAMRKGLGKLEKSLQSSSLKTGIAVVCLLTSVHGFLQYLGILPSRIPAFSIVGTFDNPAGYAAAQAAMFPFVVNLLFDKESGKLLRVFSFAVALVCLVSVVLSESRAGFLAVCTTTVVVLAYTDKIASFFKTHKWVWIPIVVLFVAILILLYFVKKDSADGRIFIWSRCIDMIRERPLFGYGAHGFRGYYMSAQADYFRNNPDSPYVMLADNVGHPFNEYLFLTIKFGVTGLILALSLLVWILLRLFKSEKKTKLLGLSFVSSMFVMSQFSYPFRYVAVWILAFIALIPAFQKSDRRTVHLPILIRLISIMAILAVLVFSLRSMYYEMKWTEISKRAIVGQADKMMKYYDGMKSVMKRDPLFLYNYSAELYALGKHEESLELISYYENMWNDYDVQIMKGSNYSALNDIEMALKSYDQAYNMIPCRFEPLFGKLLVYRAANDTLNVVQTAYEIIEKPVKVRSDRLSFIVGAANQLLSDYGQ